MYNYDTPSVSSGCFRTAMHVPLGVRVYMDGQWGREFCAVVPAPGASHPTVMDRQLQVLFFGPSGRNGGGLCWGDGSASVSAAAPSTAALAGALCLEGSDELHIHFHEICR